MKTPVRQAKQVKQGPWMVPSRDKLVSLAGILNRMGLGSLYSIPFSFPETYDGILMEIAHRNELERKNRDTQDCATRSNWRALESRYVAEAFQLSTRGEIKALHASSKGLQSLFRERFDSTSGFKVSSARDPEFGAVLSFVAAVLRRKQKHVDRAPANVVRLTWDSYKGSAVKWASVVFTWLQGSCEGLRWGETSFVLPVLFAIYERKGWLTAPEREWWMAARGKIPPQAPQVQRSDSGVFQAERQAGVSKGEASRRCISRAEQPGFQVKREVSQTECHVTPTSEKKRKRIMIVDLGESDVSCPPRSEDSASTFATEEVNAAPNREQETGAEVAALQGQSQQEENSSVNDAREGSGAAETRDEPRDPEFPRKQPSGETITPVDDEFQKTCSAPTTQEKLQGFTPARPHEFAKERPLKFVKKEPSTEPMKNSADDNLEAKYNAAMTQNAQLSSQLRFQREMREKLEDWLSQKTGEIVTLREEQMRRDAEITLLRNENKRLNLGLTALHEEHKRTKAGSNLLCKEHRGQR